MSPPVPLSGYRGAVTRRRRASRRPGATALPSGPVRTSFATAELVARDTGILLMLDGAESSFLDLRDPSHLDFEYHQQMDAVLAALRGEGGPLRALHLGGAGCALARAWDVTHPGSQQVAVEIDEILASQVRTWFDLPRSPRLRIRVGDAPRWWRGCGRASGTSWCATCSTVGACRPPARAGSSSTPA